MFCFEKATNLIILFMSQQFKLDNLIVVTVCEMKLSKYLRNQAAPVKIVMGRRMDYFG